MDPTNELDVDDEQVFRRGILNKIPQVNLFVSLFACYVDRSWHPLAAHITRICVTTLPYFPRPTAVLEEGDSSSSPTMH